MVTLNIGTMESSLKSDLVNTLSQPHPPKGGCLIQRV